MADLRLIWFRKADMRFTSESFQVQIQRMDFKVQNTKETQLFFPFLFFCFSHTDITHMLGFDRTILIPPYSTNPYYSWSKWGPTLMQSLAQAKDNKTCYPLCRVASFTCLSYIHFILFQIHQITPNPKSFLLLSFSWMLSTPRSPTIYSWLCFLAILSDYPWLCYHQQFESW